VHGRYYDIAKKSIDQSLCFGVYAIPQQQQVGFALVVTNILLLHGYVMFFLQVLVEGWALANSL
jgi:hypothetical protein